jgi:hypothetical protein
MSETAVLPTSSTSPPPSSAAANSDAIVLKVQRTIDQYKVKLQKALEENQKLRNTIQTMKSTNSRIRKIPKKEEA